MTTHFSLTWAAIFAGLPQASTTIGALIAVVVLMLITAAMIGYQPKLRDDSPRDDR